MTFHTLPAGRGRMLTAPIAYSGAVSKDRVALALDRTLTWCQEPTP